MGGALHNECLISAVSILVFVELALDVPPGVVTGDLDGSFNPCFRGTCS